jgi:glyoxylase I family protein
MNIEHIAFNVADPVAMTPWYLEHLGLRVLRKMDGPPYTHFLADSSGRVVLELYHHTKAQVPDYRSFDPLVVHIAFQVDDVAGIRQRLLAAGATSAGDIMTTDSGDVMTFLRDPWGLTVQLVKRARALGE